MAKLAVIGSGVAGLVSAHVLSKNHEVDIFESRSRLGGHSHTVTVDSGEGPPVFVDTGFIVFNEKNYPNFLNFLNELNVAYCDSDMSFSVSDKKSDYIFGSDVPWGIFAQKRNLINPNYYRFLYGVHRFNNHCLLDYEKGIPQSMTLADYIKELKVSDDVINHYILPMTSAIWSSSFNDALLFPMTSFIQFWKNHGLLEIGKGLQWKTVVNGSQSYINKVKATISGEIFLDSAIEALDYFDNKVRLQSSGNQRDYDGVVVATHADQALELCQRVDHPSKQYLSSWQYSKNETFLHTDSRFMPAIRSAWSSWNVTMLANNQTLRPASVTYWMNRLQPLPTKDDYFVTLNPDRAIDSQSIVKSMTYSHPTMTLEAMSTQPHLRKTNTGQRIVFCGSYFGYGFHEDAVESALDAAEKLLLSLARKKNYVRT